MADSMINQENVKKVLNGALKFVADCLSAAKAINPIFNVVSPFIDALQHHVNDDDLKEQVNCGIKKMKDKLDEISKQNSQMLQDIKISAVKNQCAEIEIKLANQFRSYMDMINATPEKLQRRKNDFIESYENNNSDQNMNTLYDYVVGESKLFSDPILKVYQECSQGDQQVMNVLCKDLAYLFSIGCTTMMTYCAFEGSDLEFQKNKWEEKFEKLRKVTDEWK